jgi:6-phosphogluconolactonase/glucosamine-6-phosphate isomerase/deaminase
LRKHVDRAFVYVTGEEKREVLKKILNSKENLAEYPARVIHFINQTQLYANILDK